MSTVSCNPGASGCCAASGCWRGAIMLTASTDALAASNTAAALPVYADILGKRLVESMLGLRKPLIVFASATVLSTKAPAPERTSPTL